jgi:hypothetical protein
VADYLDAANIPNVGTVWASPPTISVPDDAFRQIPTGTASGCVINVEVWQTHELRIGFGGPTQGLKTVTHDLRLHLLFMHTSGNANTAMDDHDDIVEAVLQLIRGDRTLGTAAGPAPIFQNGEGEQGITVQVGMPKRSSASSIVIWTAIDTTAVEMIVA